MLQLARKCDDEKAAYAMTPVFTLLVSYQKAERSRGLKPAAQRTARSAFTLVELLVVISIILVLLGAVIVAGPRLIDTGRSQTTQLMLVAVRDAVEEFKREQMEKPTLTRPLGTKVVGCTATNYRKRYDAYPPDELEVFAEKGLPCQCQDASLAPGRAVIEPSPGTGGKYMDMNFFQQVPLQPGASPEFRDNLAMTLAIDLFGQSSKMMLEQIAASNRREVPPDTGGKPSVYLDVNINGTFDADTDRAPYYLVDGWGVPIGYFAQRDFDHRKASSLTASSNHQMYWGPAVSNMVKRNGGQPVVFSYGPNGEDQLTSEVQMADKNANMIGDWMDAGGSPLAPDKANLGVIDHPLNRDNVYADPIVKQRLESAP